MTTPYLSHPSADEYAPFYAGYIQRVPENSDIFALLERQPDDLTVLLHTVADPQASIRPQPKEWSIKEVLGHICDTERVFAYRAVRIARGDTTPLPGFDQDLFVDSTNFNTRSLSDLLTEFALQRRANLLTFKSLTEIEIMRLGTASNAPVSVRAILYMMAGHVLHHVESFRTDYHIGQ